VAGARAPRVAARPSVVALAATALIVIGVAALLSTAALAAPVTDGEGLGPVAADANATPPTDGNETHRAAESGTVDPRIVELYPNPTTEGNRGEYLVVYLPERGDWSLSDGYHEVSISPNASGAVALSMAPEATTDVLRDDDNDIASVGSDPVEFHALDGYFPLSAAGDRIELRRGGDAVDVVDYDRVREGYRWRADWGEWRPRGYEPRTPERTANATVTPFVLPDSPEPADAPLRDADERLLLAGYTVESERAADRLVAAAERGVTVRVLVEGSPVGGFSARSAALLDRLVAAGVEVRVLDGDPDRFRFHHAKYSL